MTTYFLGRLIEHPEGNMHKFKGSKSLKSENALGL